MELVVAWADGRERIVVQVVKLTNTGMVPRVSIVRIAVRLPQTLIRQIAVVRQLGLDRIAVRQIRVRLTITGMERVAYLVKMEEPHLLILKQEVAVARPLGREPIVTH